MKSILQEASSVVNAIQKAWDEAGQPKEFSVKVLERGEKNFFGFTKKPAVVSLFFEPTAHKNEGHRGERRPLPKHKEAPQRQQAERPQFAKKERKRVDEMVPEKKERKQHPPAPAVEKAHARVPHHLQKEPREPQQQAAQGTFEGQWNAEMSGTVREWLADMLSIMKVTVPYTVREDQRALIINFEAKVLDTVEEEGMLFASFAYLLLQSLKKKHKNKFKGLRIILKTPQQQQQA